MHFLSIALLLASASALTVPDNIQAFYKKLKTQGECSDKLAGGFYNSEFDNGTTAYCGDHLEDYGVVYLQSKKGLFSNMDVDCDGEQGGPEDDGRCDVTTTTQDRTSVKAIVESYDAGIDDLNPHVHSYVVLGNDGFEDPYNFDPREYGVHQTSVMAVVCGDQMFYGIWGDVNGGDSPRPSVGEVSLSLATACYGEKMSSSDGSGTSHNAEDVLYIAFIGEDAVPGADGANWAADNFTQFHSSIVTLGNSLVERIGNSSTAELIAPVLEESLETCSWIEHCKGATCESANDCADDLTCTDGECAERTS